MNLHPQLLLLRQVVMAAEPKKKQARKPRTARKVTQLITAGGKPIDASKHVYSSSGLVTELRSAVAFFKQTPVYRLPAPKKLTPSPNEPTRFLGPGVYALYYRGDCDIYEPLSKRNDPVCVYPIYVGSALPLGWRKARATLNVRGATLYTRLRQHASSIADTRGDRILRVEDFWCRFMILNDPESRMITAVESQLIYEYKPLWNSQIDGFGNHVVGKYRETGKLAEWDVVHSGRAGRATTAAANLPQLLARIQQVLAELGAA